jgi:HPt (histidine-containing phosphotransfer) domain-containing protein
MAEVIPDHNRKLTDLTYMKAVAKGSNSFISQMLDIFISQTPGLLEGMEKALAENDWNSIARAAHKLKPNAVFVGLTEIDDAISLLERYCSEASNPDKIPALIEKIKVVSLEAIPELQEELKRL